MKKPSNNPKQADLAITATIEESCMLQLLVETLAESHSDSSNRFKKVQPGWKAFRTSSIEARVSGIINVSGKKNMSLPFVTGFVFTCTKAIKGKYDLTWSNSLS
jgi:hypothetical protein